MLSFSGTPGSTPEDLMLRRRLEEERRRLRVLEAAKDGTPRTTSEDTTDTTSKYLLKLSKDSEAFYSDIVSDVCKMFLA